MTTFVTITIIAMIICIIAWWASENEVWPLGVALCATSIFGCMLWDTHFSQQAEQNRYLDSIQGPVGIPDLNDLFIVSAFLPLPIVVAVVVLGFGLACISVVKLFGFIVRYF